MNRKEFDSLVEDSYTMYYKDPMRLATCLVIGKCIAQGIYLTDTKDIINGAWEGE